VYLSHTIYRMIYFSWNNFIWVHMFSKYVWHLFFINRILCPITSDVMNTVTLSTWQYVPNTKTQNDNKIKVSSFMNHVARINKILHYVKHDHQYRRNFKSLNIIWCIVFLLHLLRCLIFFSQEIRNFDFVVILCLHRNGKLFEYNHFKIISHYWRYLWYDPTVN
jgi:hypothetical protein